MNVSIDSLSFRDLRKANVKRCVTSFHHIDSWSPTDWACAMAGEAGEACNVIKKLRRLLDTDARIAHEERDALVLHAMDEIADMVIYADLLSARLGMSLELAIRTKFDKTSKKVGSNVFLGEHTT